MPPAAASATIPPRTRNATIRPAGFGRFGACCGAAGPPTVGAWPAAPAVQGVAPGAAGCHGAFTAPGGHAPCVEGLGGEAPACPGPSPPGWSPVETGGPVGGAQLVGGGGDSSGRASS